MNPQTLPGVAMPATARGRLTRVAIHSDVRLLRESLQVFFERCPDFDLVALGSINESLLPHLEAAEPDVVLVDLSRGDPGEMAARLRGACSAARLVPFALVEQEAAVLACAAAGFCGYVAQDGGVEEIGQAVRDAMAGRLRCSPDMAARLFGHVSALLRARSTPETVAPVLTRRESEILALVELGHSNKDIARRLAISAATVKNHMHSILQKLQISRRGQAAARLRALASS